MNGWLAKKSDNLLIQIAIVCNAHPTCEHVLSRGVWGHAPTEIFFANLAYIFSIKFLTEK